MAAGGRGLRFNAGDSNELGPKQFLELAGRPLYMWSLLVLAGNSDIGRVVVTCPVDYIQLMVTQIKSEPSLNAKTIDVIAGGISRQESVYLALQHLNASRPKPSHVLVHDAARPFLDNDTVCSVVSSVVASGACTVGIPSSDTVKRVVDNHVVGNVERSELVLVQTPQAGSFELLVQGHAKARNEGFETTDDAAILELMQQKVKVVPGHRFNIKVTEHSDLPVCRAIASILLKNHL